MTKYQMHEAIDYIGHRLKVAGGDADLFDEEAKRLVFEASRGIPRSINILCDTALVYGFAIESPKITATIVKNVIDDKNTYGVFPVESANKWPVPLKEVEPDEQRSD